ncbi:NUDIX hydrolase domain-like protein, partial [Melanogaster broomeanus]
MPPDDALFRGKPNFMKYPTPTLELFDSVLPTLKDDSRQCIQNLLNYRATRTLAQFPRSQSAAVLVPLFVGRSGDLYVLLSRRSEALRAYAGDTALPGGKVDPQDVTVEGTARREAFEEIGLPEDKERVPLLCVMEPHIAGNQMVVTPVVVLILDKTLQPNLNSSEVTSIFSQPLASFLSSTPHGRSADLSRPYHTFIDQPWGEGGAVRLHKFLTGREAEGVKPVFGLTASILIKTATIGYGRTPEFEVQPPHAPTSAQQIAHALLTPSNPLRIACDREAVDANKTAARMLRAPMALNAARTLEWEKIGADWKRLM